MIVQFKVFIVLDNYAGFPDKAQDNDACAHLSDLHNNIELL